MYVESTPHTDRWQDPKSNTEKLISKTSYRVEQISFIANLKGSFFNTERDLTEHEIGEYRESVKDIDHISIAKNILKDAGYQVTKI